MGEIPLVFGLMFATGPQVVLAHALGRLAILALQRKLAPIRLAFNLGQFLLGGCVTVVVFHAVAGSATVIDPAVWGAAALATTSLGLCAVSLAYHDWRTAILLALPVTGTFVIFHAYTRERQRHLRIEFLYESARELSRSSEIGPAMKDLLARALEAFPRRGGGGHLLLARRGRRAAHHRPAGR